MDTQTPTTPTGATGPEPAKRGAGGIVKAPPAQGPRPDPASPAQRHPDPTHTGTRHSAPRTLAWLAAGVLALHLGALAWWWLPDSPDVAAPTGTTPMRLASTPADPPPTAAAATTPSPEPSPRPSAEPAPAANRPRTTRPPATVASAPHTGTETGPPLHRPGTAPATENNKQKHPVALALIEESATTTAWVSSAPPESPAVPTAEPTAPPPPPTSTEPAAAFATPAETGPGDPLPAPHLGHVLPVRLNTVAAPARAKPHTPASQAADALAGPLDVPPSTTLSFRVKASRKGMVWPASSSLSWETDGANYSAKLVIEAPFVRKRSQTSVGTVDPVLGLQPRRFGDKNRTEVATHFDRTRTPPVIRFSANAPQVPLQPQSQDRLSVLIQLAALVAGDPQRFEPGQRALIHTAGSRDAEPWAFVVVGTEELALPVGHMTGLHLVREPQSAYDNRVDVWLAPMLGHLPVRILWTQSNGDVVDQQLESHTP